MKEQAVSVAFVPDGRSFVVGLSSGVIERFQLSN